MFVLTDERLGIFSPIQQLIRCDLLNEVEIGLSTSSALERYYKTLRFTLHYFTVAELVYMLD
jgi:hypothetical protein